MDEINTKVTLDFEQRARAIRLESAVSDDEYAAAAEIIYLRDELARLQPIPAASRNPFHAMEVRLEAATERPDISCLLADLRKIADDFYTHGLIARMATVHSAIATISNCSPFLKDDETPAECIDRNRKDITTALGLLAAEKRKNEQSASHSAGASGE